MFTLDQMLRATGGRVIHGAPNGDERFVGGAFDSRIAEPGSVFFALRDQRDGHEFVADAFAHGDPSGTYRAALKNGQADAANIFSTDPAIAANDFVQLEDWHRKRYLVLPGMTGLWQVSGRIELTFDDLVRLDFYYLENWSIWLDISILGKTLPAVIARRGAY